MRILHLSSEFPPQSVYGLGRYVYELAISLTSLGHHVDVITNSLGGKDFETEVHGVRVKRVHFPPPPKAPSTSSMLLHFNLQLMERLLGSPSDNYDVVNAHDWLTVPASFHAARLLKAPLVTTLHDIVFNKVRGREFNSEDAYIAGIENWAVHSSTRTILLSRAVCNEVISNYHAPGDRMVVIPGGVGIRPPLSEDLHSLEAFRSKLAPNDENLILYVGRLDPEKGLPTLFNALTDLDRDEELIGKWKLAVAGTGTLKEGLEGFCRENRLQNKVAFLGYLPFDELRIAYAAADIVVTPSDYEPFGLVALEAQRMGTPVVVSHTGGLAETLERTSGGLSFAPGKAEDLKAALKKLLVDPDLRSQMGKNGQKNVGELYTWGALAKQVAAVYETILRSNPPENITPPEWQAPKPPPSATKAPQTSAAAISELTLFWDTAFMPQLRPVLEQMVASHALNVLSGKINVIPIILTDSKAQQWVEPLQDHRIRYVKPDDDAQVRESLKNSAALFIDARLAGALLKLNLVVPALIPTFWIGAKNAPREGGWGVSTLPDIYTLATKALCDNTFRRSLARELFNPIPEVGWKPPGDRKTSLIVHVLPQLVTGGAETVLLDLTKGTSPTFSHEILCLGPLEGPLPDEFRNAGIAITQISPDAPSDAIEWLRTKQPEIIHLHSMSYVPHWMRIHRGLGAGVRIIETEHVVNIGAGHFGRVDVVACVSEATRKVHDQYIDVWRGRGAKYRVIYNGIDTKSFADLPSKSEARARLELPLDRPIIGRVSALARNKLPQEALESIPHILRLIPNALFVIVGDGPQRRPAEAWVREKGLADSVLFIGERRDIPQVLRAFDVFAYYTMKDALGNVILEAVAAGVPVVTTDVEGTKEALGDAPGSATQLGKYEEFANEVQHWLKETNLNKNLSYALPRKFSRASMAESYSDLYWRVLDSSTAPRTIPSEKHHHEQKPVTVLMPVFNARKDWLLESLASIKAQTFKGWKLLIVDDGSEREYRDWLRDTIHNDRHLAENARIVRFESNRGVAAALSAGLNECKTELVARMDADDRMAPDRLALQLCAFQQQPQIAVLGGWARLIDEEGRPINGQYSYPCGHRQIVRMLGSSCAFAHPTVMYRRSAVLSAGGYKNECRHFEDYDLWVRMAQDGHRFANLPVHLLEYRVHSSSVSRVHQERQSQGSADCAQRAQKLKEFQDQSHRPRIIFTGVQNSYGIPGRGLSIEQAFFARGLEHMVDIDFKRMPADELVRQHGHRRAGELLLENANEWNADLVFTVLGNPELDFLPEHIQALTDSGRITLNWNCDDHWRFPYTSQWVKHYSHMVTTDPQAMEQFKQNGFTKKVTLSQWGCNPIDHSPGNSGKDIDVSFIGQPYGNRPAMIQALRDAGLSVVVHGAGWKDGKEIDFIPMIDTLRRSRIVLNFSHATQGQRRQLKARFFEIPACGSFMLTEPAEGMERYLRPGRHYDTFNSSDELVTKARAWLARPDRDALAYEASAIIRSVHTYPWRLQEVFEAVRLYDRR